MKVLALAFVLTAIAALVQGEAPCTFSALPNVTCDGSVDDTEALQACLDGGGSFTLLPGSACTSGPLQIKVAGARLEFQRGSRLRAKHRKDWPTAIGSAGNLQPLLFAQGLSNVTLTGSGIIEGRGEEWWPKWYGKDIPRPKLLVLSKCDDVVLEHFTMLNGPSFHIDITDGGKNYVINGLNITSPNFQTARNTDGIDIAAFNVHVHDVFVSNGDDSICVKAPAGDILVENCVVENGNGFVIGTAQEAFVQNVTFRNSRAVDTTFGCHIKFKPDQRGLVHAITFESINVVQTANAWWRRVSHFDWGGYAIGIHQLDQGRRRLSSSPDNDEGVRISNIVYRNISGKVLNAGEFVCGSGNLTYTELVFENIRLEASRRGCKFTNARGNTSGSISPSSCVPPS